jgi:hypothetical protein
MKPYINQIMLFLLVIFFAVFYFRGNVSAGQFLFSTFAVLLALFDPRAGQGARFSQPLPPADQPKQP